MTFLDAIKVLMDQRPSDIQKQHLTLDELSLIWDIGFALGYIPQSKEEWVKQ